MTPSSRSDREPNVEYHDGDEPAVCVGQWCCGCPAHPIGKPWGWNYEAWEEHYDFVHPNSDKASAGVDSGAHRAGPRRANDRAHGHRGKDPQ